MDILVGMALLVLGLVVCFSGLRVFFAALPLVGFVAGFFVGAAGVRAVFGESFLSGMTGVIVGLIVGIALAIISYLLWYIGALLSAGSSGALIGSGIMNVLGVSSGWIVFIGAVIGAILLFAIAYMLALPIYVVIINTAFIGAAAVVTGIMLTFGQIERGELGYGTTWAMIEESWVWLVFWAALTAIGILGQMRIISSVTLPEDRWGPASQPVEATV